MNDAQSERAFAGWMEAIAASGWKQASAELAASHAAIDGNELRGTLGDRHAALAHLQERTAAAATAAAAAAAGNVRDRLFDGFMAGFDLLQRHRPAVLAIWKARNPPIALLIGGRAGLDLRRLAMAAGVDIRRLRGRLRGIALAAIGWRAFLAWVADDSPDMAATMAALDRLLDRAGRVESEGILARLPGAPLLAPLCRRGQQPHPVAG